MSVPLWYKHPLHLGDSGPDVRVLRRKLGLDPAGPYDRTAMAIVKGKAKIMGIETDGVVDADMASAIGPAADEEIKPDWFHREIRHFDMGPDVQVLNRLLGLDPGDDRYREETEKAVLRMQSALGAPLTGVVDDFLAKHLGQAE